MKDEQIIEMLKDRIEKSKINPVTVEAFKLEDIKIKKYKDIVSEKLNQTQTAE